MNISFCNAKQNALIFQLMFLTVDLDQDDNQRVIEYLHLKNTTMPAIMIVKMKTEVERFRPVPGLHDNLISGDWGIDFDKVFKFGLDFLQGDVPRYYHSEDTPKDWNENLVKVLMIHINVMIRMAVFNHYE